MQRSNDHSTVPLKDFKELNRLAFVVRRIEENTHVAPEGAYKLNPLREVKLNLDFKGKIIIRDRSEGDMQFKEVLPFEKRIIT